MPERIVEYLAEEAETYLLGALRDLYRTATPVRVAYESGTHFESDRPLLPVTPAFPSRGGEAFYAIDVREWNVAAEAYKKAWDVWANAGKHGLAPAFEEPIRKRFLVSKVERVVVGKPFPVNHPIVKAAQKRQPTSSWA